jgi:hypothetical protein|uniref:Uncharacterized protein n=1 Tax=Fagus sylvatica TaxID=28930 RepID=A0A2N9EFP2_FAGSY
MGGECQQFYCWKAYGQRVGMDTPLLQCASRSFHVESCFGALGIWDPTRHVFCFNQCKLCPMIEEFAVLMYNNDFRFNLFPPQPRRALDILD